MRNDHAAGIIVTARDIRLLRTLLVTRVLDSEQVGIIAGFISVRRTNRRLLKLVRAGLLRRWFVGTVSGGQRALYGLSRQGSLRIGENPSGLIHWKTDALITNSQFLAHQQAVNAVFIQARFRPLPTGVACRDWLSFKVPLSASVPLVPDGYFEIVMDSENAVHPMFVEADLGTESSTIWMRKVELYLKLAIGGEFERRFRQKRFRVLVLLPSERRREALRKAIARRTDKLFWFGTLDDLGREGLCAPIWLRPVGEEKLRLLGEPVDGGSRISEKRESGWKS